MTDEQLLIAAAKASGLYEQWPAPDNEVLSGDDGLWCRGMGKGELWNPLTDDGDALRLAVKLEMSFDYREDGTVNAQWYDASVWTPVLFEQCGNDPAAATRRAIVRAAAALAPQGVPEHG